MRRQYIDLFVYFIIGVKFIYSCIFFYNIYLKNFKKDKNTREIELFSRYESYIELLVIFCLGLLLILLFNPHTHGNVVIDHEMKVNLYLLGFVLLFSVKDFWDKLFTAVSKQS
jgi:hypothetical protein